MKILLCFSIVAAVCIGLSVAAPTCIVEGNCKDKMPFYPVDCMEKLKFKHPKASCFMNDADEFLILALNEERIAKRSLADLESYRSPAGDKAIVYRLKRSAYNNDAEVLSPNDIKKMLNQDSEVLTESPVTVIPTSDTDTNGDNDDDTPKGIIIVIGFESHNYGDLEVGNGNSLSGPNGEEEMAEALFGLLLLGAILDEINKHQNDAAVNIFENE